MYATTKEISEIFSVTPKTVNQWARQGMPKIARGKFSVREVVQWWAENIYAASEDTGDINEAKTRYWQAKARSETVKADTAEGEVAPIADYTDAWAWRISEMSSGIGQLHLRLAPLVAGQPEIECRKILESELWAVLDKFSREGEFTPAAE